MQGVPTQNNTATQKGIPNTVVHQAETLAGVACFKKKNVILTNWWLPSSFIICEEVVTFYKRPFMRM